jgi:epoxyqueuosine reductase
MTSAAKAQLIRQLARAAGFDLVGITVPRPLARVAYYRRWLAAGYGADMHYLHRNVRLRAEPAGLLPGAKSIICVAVAYKRADGYVRPHPPARSVAGDAAPATVCAEPTGRIAQYARGHDYHVVLHYMLDQLIRTARDELREPFEARTFVDTAPVLERELAAAAGLGWIGRNTCLLNDHLGSYLLLAEAVTTLDLPPDPPAAPRCGRCTRCIDTCPTRALVQSHVLDASRCIAYLTIEHCGEIPAELQPLMGDRVFGCDVCQQVCPYNARAPLGTHPGIIADRLPDRIALRTLLDASHADYRRLVRGTAMHRARIEMLRRNGGIVLANSTHS